MSTISRSRPASRRRLALERLERRECMAGDASAFWLPLASDGLRGPMGPAPASYPTGGIDSHLLGQLAGDVAGQGEGESPMLAPLPTPYDPADSGLRFLTDGEVELLLARAAAASSSQDAIIAIV